MIENVLYQLTYPKEFEPVERFIGIPGHVAFPETFHAVDFRLPVDTPVLAARAGRVIAVKDDSGMYGFDMKFAEHANYVGVQHDDGSCAEYVHLRKDGVVVKENQTVKAGDLLGYTGLSGLMSEPHLHFNVFVIENEKARSIPVVFEERK